MLITSEGVKHQIDIVNPYIKLLGSTDIMSGSEEEKPGNGCPEGAISVPPTLGIPASKLKTSKLKFMKKHFQKGMERTKKLYQELQDPKTWL